MPTTKTVDQWRQEANHWKELFYRLNTAIMDAEFEDDCFTIEGSKTIVDAQEAAIEIAEPDEESTNEHGTES